MRLPAALFTLAAVVLAIVVMCLALADLNLPARLFGFAAIAMTIAGTWYALRHTYRPRDPLAYYLGWGGYWHPIGLHRRVTKEKAEQTAAEGYAYLIGEYNETGQLVRVTKMLKGEVFFQYSYTYHDNGMLKTARVARSGRETLLQWDQRGKPPEGQHNRL